MLSLTLMHLMIESNAQFSVILIGIKNIQTATVNSRKCWFYHRNKDELLFPPLPSCPVFPTTPILLYLDTYKDTKNGPIMSVVFIGIKTIKTTTVNGRTYWFYSRNKDELLFPPQPSCPESPTTPTIFMPMPLRKKEWPNHVGCPYRH
jgi:hypothetical protein